MTVQKSKKELEKLFRLVVLRILELPEDDIFTVRYPYGGAPAFSGDDNVCFVYVLPSEDGYGKISELSCRDDGGDKFTHVDSHTEALTVNFVCYGPRAYEWAGAVKDGMNLPEIRRLLWENTLAYVLGSMTLTYAPELVDKDWQERCDAQGTFYQYVRLERAGAVGAIDSVHVGTIPERSS